MKSTAQILNLIGQESWHTILSKINERDPELAMDIKNLVFVFQDIVALGDRYVQRVTKEADNKELALAPKDASAKAKERIFSNLSERAANIIKMEGDPWQLQRLAKLLESMKPEQAAPIITGLSDETTVARFSARASDRQPKL